jgi:2-polyprenyl-3-methyl-5-hydroxy-6-metoxy-1,4-benzoquinol methylase
MGSQTRGLRAMIRNKLLGAAVYTRAEYWDSKADEFGVDGASGWTNGSLNDIYHRKEIELLEKTFPDVKNLHVLDAGCGTGRLTRYFARRGARVTGIDFSARAIEFARGKALGSAAGSGLESSGSIRYRVESVLDLVEESVYDVAVTFGVLTVACGDRGALARAVGNLFRALKPGGRLLMAEPFHRGPLGLSLRVSLEGVLGVVRGSGFEVEGVWPMHFWPISRPLAYVALPGWVTGPMYGVGDFLLGVLKKGGAFFGDYKVVLVKKPLA